MCSAFVNITTTDVTTWLTDIKCLSYKWDEVYGIFSSFHILLDQQHSPDFTTCKLMVLRTCLPFHGTVTWGHRRFFFFFCWFFSFLLVEENVAYTLVFVCCLFSFMVSYYVFVFCDSPSCFHVLLLRMDFDDSNLSFYLMLLYFLADFLPKFFFSAVYG